MAYRKRIIERGAKWTGLNGRRFDTSKYLDVVYYTKSALDENKPQYIWGATGAVVGGSGNAGDITQVVKFINMTLKPKSPRATIEEVRSKTLRARKEMLEGKHKWNIPGYGEYDEWYHVPNHPDDW